MGKFLVGLLIPIVITIIIVVSIVIAQKRKASASPQAAAAPAGREPKAPGGFSRWWKNNSGSIITFLVIVILVLTALPLGLRVYKGVKNHKPKTETKSKTRENLTRVLVLPDIFTEYFELKKDTFIVSGNDIYQRYYESRMLRGDTVAVRVTIPAWYSYTHTGMNYYLRAQNGKKIRYPNKNGYHSDGDKVGYIDLSCCGKETTVAVEFKKVY